MNAYRNLLTLLFLGLILSTEAQPPKPAEGYRWMLNQQFSDEFNGDELDLDKWYNYHPYWQGRPPAKFMPSQVSVKDGLLVLKNKKIETSEPGDTWTIAGAAVVSKTRGAHFGYYECSQKASKIRMSSTFWMSNGSAAGPDPCSGDRYSQELDIQEAVGGAASNSQFTNSMSSNSHYNYYNCQGVKTNYSAGSRISLEEGEVSDTFHVYAAHWKHANGAALYLDGKYGNSITFRTDVDPTPFERPMQINMVTETYDWVSPPSDEDLADDSRNTTYIDWVRSWKLVPVDHQEEEEDGLIENGGFETGDFQHWTGWGGDPLEVVSDQVHSGNYAAHVGGPGAPEYEVNLRAFSTYTLSCYGKVVQGSGPIHFGIKDPEEKVLGSVQVTETSYTKKSFQFTTESSGLSLKFYFYAPNAGTEGYADDFSLVLNEASDTIEQEEPSIFEEKVYFDEEPRVLPAFENLEIRLGYQANGDRQIHLKLFDTDSVLIGENTYPAYAGYGIKKVALQLDSVPPAGKGYQLVAEILHPDSTVADPSQSDVLTIELQNPVDVSILVLDVRNDQPVSGAMVGINEVSKETGETGSVDFQDVPPGVASVKVQKEGFDDLLIEEMELRKDTMLELRILPETRRVAVVLTDSYNGDPVSAASLQLGDQNEISSSNGEALFLTYAGSYALEVEAAMYYPDTFQVSFAGDTSLHLELKRSLADVKFVVKNKGSYLTHALISLAGISEYTSSIGMAYFSDLKTDSLYSYTIDHSETGLIADSLTLLTDSTLRINLGITDIRIQVAEGMGIYPNPAKGVLRVYGLEEATTYMISNVLGKAVLNGVIRNEDPIDVSDLQNGIYFITLGDASPLKFIKQ